MSERHRDYINFNYRATSRCLLRSVRFSVLVERARVLSFLLLKRSSKDRKKEHDNVPGEGERGGERGREKGKARMSKDTLRGKRPRKG